MQSDKHVSRNFLFLFSGEALSRVIAFGVTVFIARVLGAEDYGVIAFAAGINLYFMRLADFAIEWVGAREVVRQKTSFGELAAAVTAARLIFALLLGLLAIGAAQLILPEPESTVLSLYLLTMLPIALNPKWIHLGLEDARPIGLARIAGETLGLVIVLVVMMRAAELWVPPVAMLSSEIMVTVLLIYALRRRNIRCGLTWNLKKVMPIFRAALPVLAHLLLGLFIYNSDLIFLRAFSDSEAVGYYAAAYTLISLLANLGLAYGMSLLPALTRMGKGTEAEQNQYQTALAHIFAICFPISVGGFVVAASIIGFAFGESYTHSVLALQILIWSVPLNIFRNVPWAALIARDREDLLLKAVLIGAAGNVLFNIILIPPFGIAGAAVATVFTESLVGILMLIYSGRQGLSFVPLRRLWRTLVASVLMGLAVMTTAEIFLPLAVLLGVALYALVLGILGGIRFEKGQLPGLNV